MTRSLLAALALILAALACSPAEPPAYARTATRTPSRILATSTPVPVSYTPAPLILATRPDETWNMRVSPNDTAEIIVVLYGGTQCVRLDVTDNGWYHVRCGGLVGYVNADAFGY